MTEKDTIAKFDDWAADGSGDELEEDLEAAGVDVSAGGN